MAVLTALAGLAIMTLGAEFLIRYAVKVAAALRVSPLVIGLTVVAYGTSLPELIVSVVSAARGQPEMAIGNVVGSNIFNILFVLGLSALILPLAVAHDLIRREVPLMIAVSFAMLLTCLDGVIRRAEGALLISGLLILTTWSIRRGRVGASLDTDREFAAEFGTTTTTPSPGQYARWAVVMCLALLLLAVGSRMFVSGAVDVARALGVSELIIGLTFVAAGTSLPEVATSVLAAWKGERDIAVGNVVGSNLFNILGVLGLSAVIAPEGLVCPPSLMRLDVPVMIAAAIACLPIFLTGHRIDRWEGLVFLAYYGAYVLSLILAATQAPALRTLSAVMLGFVIPLTLITLGIALVRGYRKQGSA